MLLHEIVTRDVGQWKISKLSFKNENELKMLEYCLVLQENLYKIMFHLPKRFENSKLKSSLG